MVVELLQTVRRFEFSKVSWPLGPFNPICMFELGARAHWVSVRRSNRPLELAWPRYLPARDRSTSPGRSSWLRCVRPLVALEIAARARSAPLRRATWLLVPLGDCSSPLVFAETIEYQGHLSYLHRAASPSFLKILTVFLKRRLLCRGSGGFVRGPAESSHSRPDRGRFQKHGKTQVFGTRGSKSV